MSLLVEKNHALSNAISNISLVSIASNDKLKIRRTPKNLFKQQIKIARTHDASPNVPNVVNKDIDSHFDLVLKSLKIHFASLKSQLRESIILARNY